MKRDGERKLDAGEVECRYCGVHDREVRDAAWADYARRPVSVRTAFRRWPKIRGSARFMLRRDVRQKTALFCGLWRFLCCKPLTHISFFLLPVLR
jgi:hypothetical protein